MSEIESLANRIRELDGAVGFWNKWYIAFVALTVVFGAALFIVQFMSIKRSSERADLQNRLDALKDEANRTVIAGIQGETAKANEQASANEKEAARLNKVAEDEKLARLKLTKAIAPRRLTGTQRETLAKLLSPRPWGIVIVSSLFDSESSDFADDFDAAICDAKWITKRVRNHGGTAYGVSLATAEGEIPAALKKGFPLALDDMGSALDAIGIKYDFTTLSGIETRTASPYFEPGVLYLVINHKPQPKAESIK